MELKPYDRIMPSTVLVTYNTEKNTYIEVASVGENGKIGPFRALGYQEAYALGNLLQDRTMSLRIGRIPHNLLFFNYEAGQFEVVWYTNSRKRRLFFSKDLKIKGESPVPIPPLIWQYRQNTLRVYALKKGTPISDNTVLFKAPFHNIHSSNDVCMGSATQHIDHETSSVVQFMSSVEDSFFKSWFTTMHQNPIKGNLNALYEHLMATDADEFPEEVLIETKVKLQNLYVNGSSSIKTYQEDAAYEGAAATIDRDDDDNFDDEFNEGDFEDQED